MRFFNTPKISFTIDARTYQILFLSVFLLFGIFTLQWDAHLIKYTILISTCLATQYFFIQIKKLKTDALKSALITALGLSLLVHADSNVYYFLLGTIAITGKFIFKTQGKHFINPANFGIITMLIFSDSVWISPGQWGNIALLFFVIGVLGFLVTYKVNRIDLSLFFLFSFFAVEYFYQILFLGWPLDYLLQIFTNGGFLLFTFFMLTDPVSTPSQRIIRKFWAAAIALLAFILKENYYVPAAPFWALFILSFSTPIIRYFFPNPPFLWKSTQQHITV